MKARLVTVLLGAMCLTVYAVQLSTGRPGDPDTLLWMGALTPERLWAGELWRLFSAPLVHVNPVHLAFNLYCLWVLGGAAEQRMGGTFHLIFSAAAGAVSGAGMALVEGSGAGCSGVIYAFFGYLWAVRSPALTRPMVSTLLAWIGLGLVLGPTGLLPVANSAHLTGVLYGLGVGKAPRWTAAAAAVLLAAAIAPVWNGRWHAQRAELETDPVAAAARWRRALELEPALRESLYGAVRADAAADRIPRAQELLLLGFRAREWRWCLLAEALYFHRGDRDGLEAAARRLEGAEARWFLEELARLDAARAGSIKKAHDDGSDGPAHR